ASELTSSETLRMGGHTLQTDFPMCYRKHIQPLLFIAFLSIFAAPIAAQEVDDVVRTETSLVQLNIGVVDKQGRPVTSLTQKDFVVYEDGVKQSIQHFE